MNMYRTAKRVIFKSLCQLDGEAIGSCRDVSTRGAFVESSKRPQLGTRHEVSLMFDGMTFRCVARVVRHASDGFAVEFDESASVVDRTLLQLLGPNAHGEDDLRWA